MSDQKKVLRDFRGLLRQFNTIDNRMQVSTILTLVEIALASVEKRDISTRDLEKTLGVLSGTASRNSYYWADGHQDMVGAHGYVSVKIAADDRRKRALVLTDKGKRFINQLTGEFDDGETEGQPLAS